MDDLEIQRIENEIRAIPGNSPVLDKLYELFTNGDAIAFVGAGASAGLWPLWDQFLEGFIEYALSCGKIETPDAVYLKKETRNTPLETAQQLRNKIGEHLYFEYLQNTFTDKLSSLTNGAFTQAHRALLQLPINNYVTLNYDAGLTNARAYVHPRATTSYYFWDQDEVKNILDTNNKRYVLHAHGRYDRADSIILTFDDYQRAYKRSSFTRILENLFFSKHLLMVGFGMTDPYIKMLFSNINSDYKKSYLRHIAFVGLDKEDGEVTSLMRDRVELLFGARVLFYPTENHHKALTKWLEMFSMKYPLPVLSHPIVAITPITITTTPITVIPDLYVHQPSDDENYRGRNLEFGTLNTWGNDSAIKTIAITGIGGQGKTSLVGHWLKYKRSDELKTIPVFFWSFYEDMDVKKFLDKVSEFCHQQNKNKNLEIDAITSILLTMQHKRIILVLDGLEILQDDSDYLSHGRFVNSLLEQFLMQWLSHPHKGLMVLTSRFQFPQLERFSGVSYHNLKLIRLNNLDGILLFNKLGIIGEHYLKELNVERFDGHPLALRVLASVLKRSFDGDLALFEGKNILGELKADEKLDQKLNHLLEFYEKQLKNGQKELLYLLSMFRRPIELKSFLKLLSKMKSLKKTALAPYDQTKVKKNIRLLVEDFLIEKTTQGITTHPVIRDYFRKSNIIEGSINEVAVFLKNKPAAEHPRNIEEVRDLVEAVQLLCREGEFKAADDLFKSRLAEEGYGFNIFKTLPAIVEGLECTLNFISDPSSKHNAEDNLGKNIITFYYSGMALFNNLAGNLANSLKWSKRTLEIAFQTENKFYQSLELENISLVEMSMGNLIKAKDAITQSLIISQQNNDLSDLRSELSFEAYFLLLLGNTELAYDRFSMALLYEQKRMSDQQLLCSLSGNYQSELLIRIQAWKYFETINLWNLNICTKHNWNTDIAICYLYQAWYEIKQRNFSKAEEALIKSEKILRPSGMTQEICRLDWVLGLIAEAKGEYEKGLLKANDALYNTVDKGFRLWQADLLTLRGRLWIMKFNTENQHGRDVLEKAGDDGNEALTIAEQTGYIWAKVDALELLASYHQTRATLQGINAQEERERAASYSKEATEIKSGLYLSEEQMEEIKRQAKIEFDKQIADWEK